MGKLACLLLVAMLPGLASGEENCRFFWVSRDALVHPDTLDALILRAEAAGANGLIVQVVGRGEAYYRSDILPRAAYSGYDDPLAYLLARAKPRGMEVHAWINAFLVWSSPGPPSDSSHVWHAHPEWFICHSSGKSSRDFTPFEAEAAGLVGATLSPALPEVREFVASIAEEIAVNYPVEGIHLDYIRYPGPSFGYESRAVALFYNETGCLPQDSPEAWARWRADQVGMTVETVRFRLNSSAPATLLSCAVMADPGTAYSDFGCPWREWLADGLVDFVCPMAYTPDRSRARQLAAAALAENPSDVVYGIAVYNQPVDSALESAAGALSLGAGGICVYSLNSLPSEGEEKLAGFWGSGSPVHEYGPHLFHMVAAP
jgi:uncharacterized lipoprotein YddW (UPF0748 family)